MGWGSGCVEGDWSGCGGGMGWGSECVEGDWSGCGG